MATSTTSTVKISQTIMLDIEFDKIESVRIVDVDLLILLKDGQRLVVPEGAVRAMMDNEFSINFKGQLFSVASLMELQTFKTQRVTEIGIASKSALPAKTDAPGTRDTQRVDLSGDLSDDTATKAQAAQTPAPASTNLPPAPALARASAQAPAKASTEADAQARETASALDRQSDNANSQPALPPSAKAASVDVASTPLATSGITPPTTAEKSAQVAPASLPSTPTAAEPGLSSMWKYAVGVLGAGVAAVAGRTGAKAVETAVAQVTGQSAGAGGGGSSVSSILGELAMGPFKEGTVLNMEVRGVDAAGQSIVLSSTGQTVTVDTNSSYKVTLKAEYKSYTGPIVVILSDTSPDTVDYKDETTQQYVALGSLTLRAAGYIKGNGDTTLNVTPLTELAVRSALGGAQATTLSAVPKAEAIIKANTAVALAFGLGKDVDVTTATVKTVLDADFKPAEASVGTKYALALAALSGVDSTQNGVTAAAKAEQTLELFAEHFAPTVTTTSTPSTPTQLSETLINTLIQGALKTQPTVQTQVNDTTLNVPALLAKQIAETATVSASSTPKILALVASSVSTLGLKGTLVEFHFDQAVASFSSADIQFSQPGYTLTDWQTSDKGLSWSARLMPPTTGASGQVSLSFNRSDLSGNNWTWTVDTQAPSTPSVVLAPATDTRAASDSGINATDHISNVKTPTVRVSLHADAKEGDVIIVKQIDRITGNTILDSKGLARNELKKVLTASEVQTGSVDITLNDLGSDNTYRFHLLQADAAGNESSPVYLDYSLDTTAPNAVALSNVNALGLIDFGPLTPAGLVNARTKSAGFVLNGVGGERGSTIAVSWGGKIVRQDVPVNDDGTWAVSLDTLAVPADGKKTQLVITQVDTAGNPGTATSYTVEVNAAGVTAKVLAVSVGDDNGATAQGGYSTNAQGAVAKGQSTDDTNPVVTVRLDKLLNANEVIEVYDGAPTALSKPVLVLSGLPKTVNGQYVWTTTAADWNKANALATGSHTLSARVVNTYTLDVAADVTATDAFVVQALDFNQLLLTTDPLTNQIPANQSAGASLLPSIPVNKPILGGTLATALGTNERLAVYDVYQDGEQYLGTATLRVVLDATNTPTGGYTWQYALTSALGNGDHSLSVRLETISATPVVRLAMAQDLSISLPILSIAPASVSPNGLSTDTGWSNTDGVSSNKTPMFRMLFPKAGRQVNDTITLADTNVLDASKNPTVVVTYKLTATDISRGYADFTTPSLLPVGATAATTKTLSLIASIKGSSSTSVVVKTAEPLVYVLDTAAPDAPVLSLAVDTSFDATTKLGKFITSVPSLVLGAYDKNELKLQTQFKKNGVVASSTGWTDSTELPTFLTDGSQDGTWTVFARFVDKAGNPSVTGTASALGTGQGYVSFTLDTKKPAQLAAPTLKMDTTNGGNAAYATDRVTSNFRLSDETPTALETKAKLEYRVWLDGATAPDKWYATYLDAIGAANNLTGDALIAWKNLGDDAKMAARLLEATYHVQRQQTDEANNVSLVSNDWTFTLNDKATDLVVALSNDTSGNKGVTRDPSIQVTSQNQLLSDTDPSNKWVYVLNGYTDAGHKSGNGVSTTTSTYVPPTIDGYYTLSVTLTNKAGVSSSGSLLFQRDATSPDKPGALSLYTGSDTRRGAALDDTVGVGDNISSDTAPTFIVKLPTSTNQASAPQIGDTLQLYLVNKANPSADPQPWGTQQITQNDLLAKEVHIVASSLAPLGADAAAGSTDKTYTFQARWMDTAGNRSDWSPSFDYTLDTLVSAPAIHDVQLDAKLPVNFINRQDSVTFSGTGEAHARLTLSWGTLGSSDVKTFSTDVDANGRWSLTLSRLSNQFAPDTLRLAYDSTVTVSQVDVAGNHSNTATLKLAVNAMAENITATIDSIDDSNRSSTASGSLTQQSYSINTTGTVVNGQSTDEHKPLLLGTLTEPLPVAQRADGSDQVVVRVFDGNKLLGTANVQGTTWSYQINAPLTDGSHYFTVEVYDPLTLQTGVRSAGYAITSNELTLTALDTTPGHQNAWVINDTSKPTLRGSLKVALAVDEVLAVYDQQADGSFALLGTADAAKFFPTSAGLNWSFDMPKAMFGDHTYRIQIEKRVVNAGVTTTTVLFAIDQGVKYDFNSITLDTGSDTGRSDADGISREKKPTVVIHLASSAKVGDTVVLMVNGNAQGTSHTVTEEDKASNAVTLTLPDLYEMLNEVGDPSRDGLFALSATVGGVPVVSNLLYQLDTTAPTYTPSVVVSAVTGQATGYTSDKTLKALTIKPATEKSAWEQVQVISATTGELVSDWVSVTQFNGASFVLADGIYTLHSRIADTAGNIDLTPGNDLTLRLDTHAAQVQSLAPVFSAAPNAALQQDAYLNQTEVSGSVQFKLVFQEKVIGLTLANLALKTSGASNTWPTLDTVTALNPDAHGYAQEWQVNVKNLSQLTEGQTVQLVLKNGLNVLDQAGNRNDAMSIAAQALTVDLTAALHVTGATTLASTPRDLMTDSSALTVNGAALHDGIQVQGATTGVETGQSITVSLMGQDANKQSVLVTTFNPLQVGADGRWTLQLASDTLRGLLQDRSDYVLTFAIQDRAGNQASPVTLGLMARLSASVDIATVVANSNGSEILNFDPVKPNLYISSAEKNRGALDTGDVATSGITVNGTTTIGKGRSITVQLIRDGAQPLYGTGGVVDAEGRWSVQFSSTEVGNLTEGTWQFVATGTDADGNQTTVSEHNQPSFTVDTLASLALNPVGGVAKRVNLTQNGDKLIVSGTFANVETDNTVTLQLRDKNATDPLKVVWSKTGITLNPTTGTWSYEISLAELDAIPFAHVSGVASLAEVAKLALTASVADKAGNTAASSALFELDRTAPAAPVVGSAIRQIAGATLEDDYTVSLKSTATLFDPTHGVLIAPNAGTPTAGDIATITVQASEGVTTTDQWRLGSDVWFMYATQTDRSITLGSGATAFGVTYTYDASTHQLTLMANNGVFTSSQVQALMSGLAWVSTANDNTLDQSDRVFKVGYADAFGNQSAITSMTYVVDTVAPGLPTQVTITALGGTVKPNAMNNTNTAMRFDAVIPAGEAAGGRAEFYVGGTLIGVDYNIDPADTTVTFTTNTSTASALKSKIAAGGVVTVELWDVTGNVTTATGPTLWRDVTPPQISRIASTKADGSYKAGDTIDLSLTLSEDVVDPASSLVMTLETGVIDRQITLLRDANNARLFTGTYQVQTGDTTADLSVSSVSLNTAPGAVTPQDASGNVVQVGSLPSPLSLDSLEGSKAIVIDTTPPLAATNISTTAVGGKVEANALNGTNTAMTFNATVMAGDATGGKAEFYVGSTLIGTDTTVLATDTAVTYTTATTSEAELQAAIAAGGLVGVKLYDKVGNMTSANGVTLVRDIVAPTISNITSSTANGAYKQGGSIALRLTVDEDIADPTSTLVVTLETGATDQTVTLTRDASNARLFTGTYTIQAGDTTSDLSVNGVTVLQSPKPRDAAGNLLSVTLPLAPQSLEASKNIVVDTTAPQAPTQITIIPAGGTVVANTLNSTNTSMTFSATIVAGDVTGGKAEFYVGNALIGTSAQILSTDTTVTFTTATTDAAGLQSAIAAGGVVSVKLYDPASNMTSANGVTLVRDIVVPKISQIATPTVDGAYKQGSAITLSLTTDEDIADPVSTLVVTLETGTTDRAVTLTRDANNHKLFTGTYTVQAGDTATHLSVNSVTFVTTPDAITPRDAAGNTLDTTLPTGTNSLEGGKTLVIDTTAPTATLVTTGELPNTSSLKVQSSETGVAYLVKDGVTVTDVASITGADDQRWNSVSVNTAGSDTDLSLAGLEEGTYSLFTADAAGNVSLVSSSTIVVDSTAPTAIFSTPADGDAEIGVSGNLVLTFSETVSGSGLNNILIKRVSDDVVVATLSGSSAVMTGSGAATTARIAYSGLASKTQYYVTVGNTAFKDAAGNMYAGTTATGATGWDFTTAEASISFAQVATDNYVNATEDNAVITLSGNIGKHASTYSLSGFSVAIDAGDGSTPVHATVTGYTATGDWTATVAAHSLIHGKTYTATVMATGGLAGTLTASQTFKVDTTVPTPTLVATSSLPNTSSVKVQSTEMGVAYLVKNGVAVTDVTSIKSAPDARWNEVAVDTANTDTTLSLAGLEDGTYSLFSADAAGNVSLASSSTIVVDSTAPQTPTQITITPVGGTVVANTLNSTNTSITFSATIVAGDVTGGKAEFYVGNALIGTSAQIHSTDTTVTFTTATTDAAGLQSAIAAGGVVSVKLYDPAGNVTRADGVTLMRDPVVPDAVDLLAVADTQSTNALHQNASSVAAGVALASGVQAPSTNDTASIQVVLGGANLDTAHDKLVLDAELDLSSASPVVVGNSGSGVTINTVTGLTYTYTSTSPANTLVIRKLDGSAFTGGEVQRVVTALQYKNTTGNSIVEGERTVAISYVDLAGNTGTSATVTLKVDRTAPNAVDLSSAVGAQSAATLYINAGSLSTAGSTGVAIINDMVASTATDIQKVTVVIAGAGLDLSNDKLDLGSSAGTLSLNTAASGTDQTIGTVTGLSYDYSLGAANTLVISKTQGGTLSGNELKNVLSALVFKNATNTTMQQGDRTFTLSYTDQAHNSSTASVVTLTVDRTAPSTVDLNASMTNAQTVSTVSVNAAGAVAGVALAPSADKPAADDTRRITLVLGGGISTADDTLVLDSVLALNADKLADTSGAGVTIGGIAGLTYNYVRSSKTLEIFRIDGNALSGVDVQSVMRAVKYQNTAASIDPTDRTATFSYTDQAGNKGGQSVVTLTLDAAVPTVRNVTMNSTGRQNNYVNTGDDVLVSVKFSEKVNLAAGSGTPPKLNLTIGSSSYVADYDSGTGSDTLVFKYRILAGQTDVNGISIPVISPATTALVLNSGSIRDLAGNEATLNFATVADDATLMVDTTVPTISSMTVSGTDSVGAAKTGALSVGDKIKVAINTTEVVIVNGTPTVSLNVGTTSGSYTSTRTATYVSGSGTRTLVFTYDIQAGDAAAADTVSATTTPLTLSGGAAVTDLAGNTLTNTVITAATIGSATTVDTVGVPSARVTSAALSADTAPASELGITSDTGLGSDFITRTSAQTITGAINGAAANNDVLQISLNGGTSWTDLASYSGGAWSNSNGTVTVVSGVTSYSYTTSLSGTAMMQVRIHNSTSSKSSSAYTQQYVVDTALINTFNPGQSITRSPVLSGTADPGAYIKVELDTNATINGSGASATGYELTYLTQANSIGYWSIDTASVTPTSGGVFTPLTVTPSGGNRTNIRVTAADKAGNSQVVTASAPVTSSTYTLSNANVIEGTSGTRTLAFMITRVGDLTGTATVDYAVDTINSTAVQGVSPAGVLLNGDFSAANGWVLNAGGGAAPTITSNALTFDNTTAVNGGFASQSIMLNAGQRYTVSWTQTGTAAAAITFGVSGSATLADQTISTAGSKAYSFTALASGTATLKFTDSSTLTASAQVTVDDVTLTSPASSFDYTGSNTGTVTFNAGETTKLVNFTVNGDNWKEINDKLLINLSNPSSGSVAKSVGIGVVQEVDATRMQAIYSMSDVNPNLVTFAVQVRRSSDNTVQDIGFDASGELDTAALLAFTGTTAGSKGYVVKWYDQSGNGRDMVQTTASAQGVIVNAGAVITRSDGTYGINFNNGLSSDATNNDYMMATGLAGADWTDVVISAKVQSTATSSGSMFQIGADGGTPGNRISSHYGESQSGVSRFVFDIGAYTSNTNAGRLSGGVVEQGVANDIVFEAHINGSTAAATSFGTNYAGAKQIIYKDGVAAAVDDTLPSTAAGITPIASGSNWYLSSHDGSVYYQRMIITEFSVFLDNGSTTAGSYSTPNIKVLRGSTDNDVLSYGGESGLTAIDGGNGYDVLYLQGATNLNPALLSAGMSNIEQIWAQNGSVNTITLTDAVLLKNPAPLLINMDAGDRVVLNSTTFDYSAVDTQTLFLGTTGNDTFMATGANDRIVGRGGSDTFVWLPQQTGTDHIDGFQQATDKLDISKLLQGYASGSVSSYVTVDTNGIDTTVKIDLDGPGSGSAIQNILLKDVVIYSTADQLMAAGTLKVL